MAAGSSSSSARARVATRAARRAVVAFALPVTLVACTASASDVSTDAPIPTTAFTVQPVGMAPQPGAVNGNNRSVADEPTTTTTTAPPKPMDDGQLTVGEEGPEIALLQMRLTELGYRPGGTDGQYGAATASAVMAFQKHEGLGRDGTAGEQVLARLKEPSGAGPRDASGGPRIEVDLDRQVAFVMPGDGTVSIINVSTGSGETYQVPDSNETALAYTPTGSFKVGLRIDGPEHGKLGVLYRPLYFTGAWAVHGSTSVPAYPASHGCVRTSYADQDWLFDQFPSGSQVVVYRGGEASTGAPPPNAVAGD